MWLHKWIAHTHAHTHACTRTHTHTHTHTHIKHACTSIHIIIMIIMITLTGTIWDFYNLLTALCILSNTYAQVATAKSCANHVQHLCHMVQRDSSTIKFDIVLIAFTLIAKLRRTYPCGNVKSNCNFVFHNGERKEITWERKHAQVIFKDVQMVQTLERKERTGRESRARNSYNFPWKTNRKNF